MPESLYSNSPYVLFLSVIALVLSFVLPIILGNKLTMQRLPSSLRSLVAVNVVWNLGSILGVLFFNGPMAPGSTAYIGRQLIFGCQALAWIRLGLITYQIGEMVNFTKHKKARMAILSSGSLVVVLLTALLIVAPDALVNITIWGWSPFARRPIFVSFLLVYLFFLLPTLCATIYQLLRGVLRSFDVTVGKTGAHVVIMYSSFVVVGIAFDFVVPLATHFTTWLGSFHFLVWHQFMNLFLAVLCGFYYTSSLFKDKSSFWLLQKLISKMEDGVIYYDNDGKIEYVNHGAVSLLGQTMSSLYGKSIKSVFPPNLDYFRENVYNDIRMVLNGETHSFKIHLFRSRQTLTTIVNIAFFTDQTKTLLLQQNIKTLNEQYVEYTHDLVRYQNRLDKEARNKLEKENVLNTLINALPFRVWYKNELGVYQKQNQKDTEIRGARDGLSDSPDEISVYEKEARETGEVKVYTSYEDSLGHEISQDESNRMAKNGEAIQTFDNMYIPILQGKPPYKTLCLKVDITEQRRLEQERNMLREQKFIHSRLEELGTMCGAFAHDYNNILGSQIGFCQLAQEMLPADHQAYMFVSEALKAAERGKASLGELLNAIRGNASAATPAMVFSPYMIIEDVVKKISLTLPPNIVLHSENLDKTLKIKGVVASLDRIISNLANNALFAMKQTGGSLTFVLSQEVLDSQLVTAYAPPVPAGRYAKMEISDTGTGMDSGTLERIFAPFFTTKAPGEGLGLGLSSALRLLKEGNAYFTVQTTLGEGTTFYLYWPLETETKEE